MTEYAISNYVQRIDFVTLKIREPIKTTQCEVWKLNYI